MLNIKEISIKIIEKLMAWICLLQERTNSANLITVHMLETVRRRTDRRRAGVRVSGRAEEPTDRQKDRLMEEQTDRHTGRQRGGKKSMVISV
ncbi:hypothetical protein DPMN_189414 [Dreissena polymorpha]|uniref:Uncharacterized protein n=1 Tax=Dreissena polymorpha TaxID=45954 RepID=A0A9D4ICB3_DREPO|nr:hypothetical protein DPMN_189414 [Dreissena polymorpha]